MEKLPIKRMPLPTPYPVGDINAYLIMSDPLTIIDPGLHYRPSEESLERFLKQSGLDMFDIKRIVITHGHPDHYGLAGKIQSLSGAEILVRDTEVEKIMPGREYVDNMFKTLHTTGITREMTAFDRDSLVYSIEKITAYTGECRLEFSDFKLQLLHMPGHSGGHTCLFWEEEGILLSGDALLPGISAITLIEYDPGMNNLRGRSLANMIGSLERIGGLNPRLCLPGHGDIVLGPGELAKSRIDFHMKRLEEILDIVPVAEERALTPLELSGIYYPNVKGFDRFLAVIEVVSHLDFLADEGRIAERMDSEGISRFHRPV